MLNDIPGLLPGAAVDWQGHGGVVGLQCKPVLWTAKAAGKLARGQMDWQVLAILFAGAGLFAALAWLPKLLRRKTHLVDLPVSAEDEEEED